MPGTLAIIDMTPIRGTTITRIVLMVIRMGIMAPAIKAGGIAGNLHGESCKLPKEVMVYEEKNSFGGNACGGSLPCRLRRVQWKLSI